MILYALCGSFNSTQSSNIASYLGCHSIETRLQAGWLGFSTLQV